MLRFLGLGFGANGDVQGFHEDYRSSFLRKLFKLLKGLAELFSSFFGAASSDDGSVLYENETPKATTGLTLRQARAWIAMRAPA